MPAERWIRIEFPYEIKNIFREAFPAAKYDGHRRYWLVSAAQWRQLRPQAAEIVKILA
jgi:TRAP-type mannitol/chloroaromatic compound transport system substrate-binding protein